jgi:hypothetical protein
MSSLSGYSGMRGPTGGSLQGNSTGGNIIPKGYNLGQLQQFGPEQMELFKSLFSQVSPDSYTSRLAGGDESLFNEMEAPAYRNFNDVLGGLSSRFSGGDLSGGRGSLSARRSSGFQNATTSAASNFAQDLQSQRQGLQRQAIQDLMGMSNTLLGQRPQEKFLAQNPQKQNSFLQQLLLGLSSGVGQGFGQAGAAFLGGL